MNLIDIVLRVDGPDNLSDKSRSHAIKIISIIYTYTAQYCLIISSKLKNNQIIIT